MFSKEYTARFINDRKLARKFRGRSIDFNGISSVNVAELNGSIELLSGARSLSALTADTLTSLRALKQRIDKFETSEVLSLWGFAEGKKGLDLLLPVLFSDGLGYTGLENSLFSHCRNIMGRHGEVRIANYQDLVDMSIPNSGAYGSIVDEILGIPQEFSDASVSFDIFGCFYSRPGEKPAEKTTAIKEGKKPRGAVRQMALDYVDEHGHIKPEDLQKLAGNTPAAAYQCLHKLHEDKILMKLGERYERRPPATDAPVSPDEGPFADDSAVREQEIDTTLPTYRSAQKVLAYIERQSRRQGNEHSYMVNADEIRREGGGPDVLTYMMRNRFLQSEGNRRFTMTDTGVKHLPGV